MSKKNPLTITIFGATGDLYQKKLASSLFSLFINGSLPEDFFVVGFARRPLGEEGFRDFTSEAILKQKKEATKEKVEDFLKHVTYFQGDLESLESFKDLGKYLGAYDKEHGVCSNKLYYLAVPPTLYSVIFQNIYDSGLSIPCASGVPDVEHAWSRVLVEKPFGKDMLEAEKLDQMLGELFDESQIFRIDHYLAKETVQNILNFRFENGIFEPLWNNSKIEKIRIVFHEELDVANRGDFYDELGALRDVGQNHMLQLLALVAMDNTEQMTKKEIHEARQHVLGHTKFNEALVRGQYEGYLNEEGVSKDSKTETFFRVNVSVDTPRWDGVVFELESGKALAKSEVYVEVYFKKVNARMVFAVSSNEGVTYDAYEKVLCDGISGDQTLFVSTKEIMSEWKIVADIIEKWQSLPLITYKKGSHSKEIVVL